MREKQQANAIKHIADKILIELLDSAQEYTQKNLIRAQWEWDEGIKKFTSWERDREREFKSVFI